MKLSQIKFNQTWKRREIIIFLDQLGIYVSSGLGLDQALLIMSDNSTKHRKSTIDDIKRSVESGALFSRVFKENISKSPTLVGIIEQGQLSGDFGRALNAAKMLLEREDELSKRCWSAMAYPTVIGVFACLLTIGLVRGVMPQIIPLLESLHVKLPLLTRMVIWISENFLKYGLWMGFAAVFLISSLLFLYKKYERFREVIHNIILWTPLVGGIVRSYWQALFLRSCGTMVESGLSVSLAYTNTISGVSLIPLKNKLSRNSAALDGGTSLSTVAGSSGVRFPSYISALISAGESSGTLGTSLLRGADIIDRDLEHLLKKLTSLIEPIMMAGMGCVVGAIALSIMMPIYDISRVLQK